MSPIVTLARVTGCVSFPGDNGLGELREHGNKVVGVHHLMPAAADAHVTEDMQFIRDWEEKASYSAVPLAEAGVLEEAEQHNLFLLAPDATTRVAADPGHQLRSLDYECEESPIWRSHESAALFQDSHQRWWTSGKTRGMMRWILTVVIGAITALTAVTITWITSLCFEVKFTASDQALRLFGPVGGFAVFLGFNLFYIFFANQMVQLAPMAAGSGVPEIKSYLNGVAVPHLVHARTLLMKAVGVTLSVAGGLPCGKEGPMLHIGGGLAAGCSQGKSTTFGIDTSYSKFLHFRNDKEKRDFIACGAAAGVAAAFGAPIAGVLFTLEESASFWNNHITWRTFFCTLVTCYTLFVVHSAGSWFGKLDQTFMFNFGEFYDLESDMANYNVWELSIFIFIGALGGFVGAATVQLSRVLTLRRKTQTPRQKQLEVLAVGLAMSVAAFFIPLVFGECHRLPDPDDAAAGYSPQEKELIGELVQFRCPDGKYNELASLWFVSGETAIKQLFHFRSPKNDIFSVTFSTACLLLFFIPYQLIFTVMIGCAVPGGVFIPSMIAGAALGRLVGHGLRALYPSTSVLMFADKGTYALIGCAGALAGLTRLTIAATVMLLEATGNMQYVLPLMLSVMTARFVGNVRFTGKPIARLPVFAIFHDMLFPFMSSWPEHHISKIFNLAIQDMQITVKGLPFLEVGHSRGAFGPDGVQLTAGHVMSLQRPPITIPPVINVGELIKKLQIHPNVACFPIVDATRGGVLVGTILRSTLCLLLKHQKITFLRGIPTGTDPTGCKTPLELSEGRVPSTMASASADDVEASLQSRPGGLVPWTALRTQYPHFLNVSDPECAVSDADKEACWMDLRPYINSGPYIVHHNTSLSRTYRLFRGMGLRHLCVVDFHNRVVGIITRNDLTDSALEARAEEVLKKRTSSMNLDHDEAKQFDN